MKKCFANLCNIFVVLSLASIAYAADPSPLQDFCVALPDAASAGKSIQYFRLTDMHFE